MALSLSSEIIVVLTLWLPNHALPQHLHLPLSLASKAIKIISTEKSLLLLSVLKSFLAAMMVAMQRNLVEETPETVAFAHYYYGVWAEELSQSSSFQAVQLNNWSSITMVIKRYRSVPVV